MSSRTERYDSAVKEIWTGKAAQVAVKYGESVPAATACCNTCRTCVTTNLLGLATAAVVAAWAGLARLGRRSAKPV